MPSVFEAFGMLTPLRGESMAPNVFSILTPLRLGELLPSRSDRATCVE